MPDWPLHKIRLGNFLKLISYGNYNVSQNKSIWTASFSFVLCLFHFGGSNHLHRTGNLTGAFNPLNAISNVSCIRHESSDPQMVRRKFFSSLQGLTLNSVRYFLLICRFDKFHYRLLFPVQKENL